MSVDERSAKLENLEAMLAAARAEVDRLRERLKEQQTHLLYTQKMATLGTLIAGVSHEIKTPIGAIGSMQDTLARATGKLKKALEKVCPDVCQDNRAVKSSLRALEEANRVIESGSSRTLEIVRRIRKFSRMDECEMTGADLHDEIDDTLLLLHNEFKDRVEVVKDYGDLPEVICNIGQMSQVFLNMLVNAGQAIEGDGVVTVRTLVDGRDVHVVIEDTGEGIAPENLEKIFKPGFTTKRVGVGTGIGLSICKQILEEHRGRIEIDSEVGRGTRISIIFPVDGAAKE